MRSALYSGRVRHRRFAAVPHEFSYRVAMPLLDLEELEPGGPLAAPFSGLAGRLCRFERADYLGDPRQPLLEAVRDHVEEHAGLRPSGPVRLLTNLRTAGYNFNPISVYFCDGASAAAPVRVGTAAGPEAAAQPVAVVVEVTNTPWGERTAYVAVPPAPGPLRNVALTKSMHVSPFLPMDLEYRFSCSVPGQRLAIRFELRREGARVFDADLWARWRPLDRRGVWALLAAHPLMPQRVTVGIYLQAARLALRGAPFYAHPSTAARDAA